MMDYRIKTQPEKAISVPPEDATNAVREEAALNRRERRKLASINRKIKKIDREIERRTGGEG